MTRAAIAFADLEVEFQSAEPGALELVRQATAISPGVVAGRGGPSAAVQAELSIGVEPRWIPRDAAHARAESPLDGQVFVAVLRAAMCQALAPEGALLHSAGAAVGGAGFLLVAPSGGGKTTISGLLSRGADILSDETICVRPDPERPGRYLAYGTCFWSGPAYPSRAGALPLWAICFLRKGPPSLTPLPRPRALRELLAQLHLPLTPDAVPRSLDFAGRLLSCTPAFALSFALDSDPLALLQQVEEPRP